MDYNSFFFNLVLKLVFFTMSFFELKLAPNHIVFLERKVLLQDWIEVKHTGNIDDCFVNCL